ncbi:MAG: FtsX-like permease family protein [Lachnospiraceae bacterium]
MKKRFGKDRIYLLVTGVLIQIVLLLPWFITDGKRFTTYGYFASRYGKNGVEALVGADLQALGFGFVDIRSMLSVLWFHMVLLIILQVLGIINLILLFGRKKRVFLCIVSLVICAANIFAMPVSPLFYLGDWGTKLFLLVILILEGIHFIGFRMIDSWTEATEEMRRIKQREKEAKKERRERLVFEGKYSSLFYKIIRKNFKASWKVYRLFIFVGCMSISFIFAGFGMREMLSQANKAENLAMGQGLGTIVLNFLAVAIVISIALIVSVLMFYLKNHVKNYALFLNLGMRSRTLYLFVAIEIVSCIIISIIGGCVIGNIFLLICKIIFKNGFGDTIVLEGISIKTYLLTFAVSFLIFLISGMATRDIYIDTGASSSRYKDVLKEKMPGRLSPVFLIFGIIFIFSSFMLISKREKAEGVSLVILFFAGLYLFLKHFLNLYLKARKKKKTTYFVGLIKKNYFYHHFKTAFRYLFLITFIHISVLFLFSREAVSSVIADKPETMFPYDYVCMATDDDEELFKEIKKDCDAEIFVYPMVRVTNVDNTSILENFSAPMLPQGQHIGISQSTYEILCEKAGHEPKKFELNDDGSNVFLVFQEDKSVKTHPIDYYLLDHTKPYLHIGQPVTNYNYILREEIFQPREVAGMERENLVGNFRQGEYENIVVFSDEYFSKVQDLWKTTNLLNGEALEEGEGIEGVNMHHWPDRLVLINAQEKEKGAVEEKLKQFGEKHVFDEKFDSVVRSWYSGDETLDQMKSERFMNIAVGFFIMMILTVVTLVLLYMKVESEMKEKIKQQEFLECMGMRTDERIRVIKSELEVFLWFPMAVATISAAVFTVIIWKIRMYSQADCISYGKMLAVVYLIYAAVQILGVKGLEQYIIKKAGGSHEKNYKNR